MAFVAWRCIFWLAWLKSFISRGIVWRLRVCRYRRIGVSIGVRVR